MLHTKRAASRYMTYREHPRRRCQCPIQHSSKPRSRIAVTQQGSGRARVRRHAQQRLIHPAAQVLRQAVWLLGVTLACLPAGDAQCSGSGCLLSCLERWSFEKHRGNHSAVKEEKASSYDLCNEIRCSRDASSGR